MSGIDPVEYGKLLAKVEALEKEMTTISDDVKTLLALANKSRGGLWVGMTFAASIGSAATWIAHKLGLP